jgi:hypothetical protein
VTAAGSARRPPWQPGVCPTRQLALVEIQSIMQFLPAACILRLARVCRATHAAAALPLAWRFATTLPVTLRCEAGVPPCPSSSASIADAASAWVRRVGASSRVALGVRWVGSDVWSSSGMAALARLSQLCTIAALHVDMDAAAPPRTPGAPAHSWGTLCADPSMRSLSALTLGEHTRDLHVLSPALQNAASSSPLTLLPSLTLLDLREVELYGNLLRCVAWLPTLRTLQFDDGDWGLQRCTSTSPTRLLLLARCSHLTELHVRRPFLHAGRFAQVCDSALGRTLRKLTLEAFDASMPPWLPTARTQQHVVAGAASSTSSIRTRQCLQEQAQAGSSCRVAVPAVSHEFEYRQAFSSLSVLEELELQGVCHSDELLAALSSAPTLRCLRIQPVCASGGSFSAAAAAASMPCVSALLKLLRASPSLHVRLLVSGTASAAVLLQPLLTTYAGRSLLAMAGQTGGRFQMEMA